MHIASHPPQAASPAEGLSARLAADIRAYGLLAPLLLRLLAPLLRLLASLDSLFARFRAGTLPPLPVRTPSPTRARIPAAPANPQPATRAPRTRRNRPAPRRTALPAARRPAAQAAAAHPIAHRPVEAHPPRPRARDSPRVRAA